MATHNSKAARRLQRRSNKLLLAAVMVLPFLVQSVVVQAAAIDDPTRPSGFQRAPDIATESFKLESVLLGSNRKIAIINGESYVEGDRTELGKVLSISRERVVIQGSARHVLELGTQSIKKQVEAQ